jgi:ribosomal protein L29
MSIIHFLVMMKKKNLIFSLIVTCTLENILQLKIYRRLIALFLTMIGAKKLGSLYYI